MERRPTKVNRGIVDALGPFGFFSADRRPFLVNRLKPIVGRIASAIQGIFFFFSVKKTQLLSLEQLSFQLLRFHGKMNPFKNGNSLLSKN